MKVKINFASEDIKKNINSIPEKDRAKFLECYYRFINASPNLSYDVAVLEFDTNKNTAIILPSKKKS